MIYLDNSATTVIDDEVLDLMNLYYKEYFGNPSSLHRMGLMAEKGIDKAREQVAKLIKVDKDCIYFVSGGTEANNFAIMSSVQKNKRRGNRLITIKIEHPSVLEVFRHYEEQGYCVIYLDVDENGFVDLQHLEESISEDTILISIMKVNNEVGSIQDIEKISKIAKKIAPHCIVHSDCVQAIGKIDFDPIKEGVDIATISGHKFHGPKGIGAIYIKKDLNLPPVLLGGGQERGLRSGTENVPGIVGLGLSCEKLIDEGKEIHDKLKRLKEYAMQLIEKNITGIHFNCKSNENYAPHILNISIEDVKSEVLLHLLEKKEIYVSSGSACSSRKKTLSHVLNSMKVDSKLIDGSLRISFSKYNTLEEIEEMVKVLKDSVENLRKFMRRR